MSLVIPAACWSAVVEALGEAPHDREHIAYLDGPIPTGNVLTVTTVTLPEATERRGSFDIIADQMSRAGRHLRPLGMLRLAQVHSHPNSWTGHSRYDDSMAFSQRDGAISIVVPHFARCAPGLGDCGVHVREPNGWRELYDEEKAARARVVPSLVDLRS
jgi:hypothetical protein